MTALDDDLARLRIEIQQIRSRLPAALSEEYTATTGSVAAGAEAGVTVAHGLGRKPSVVVGHIEDGSNASGFSWRAVVDAVNVAVVFRNNGSVSAQAILRFRLVF